MKQMIVRKHVTIPGMLTTAVTTRFSEFGYSRFSPYAVELVYYDLRTGAEHTLTLPISQDTAAVQGAVDHRVVQHYRPGIAKDGLLIHVMGRLQGGQEIAAATRDPPHGPALSKKEERISFPAMIWPLVDRRWRELGYPSFSAYITGLIRYDLMVGGPHMFTAADLQPEIQEALMRETAQTYLRGEKRKTFLEYRIEDTFGRSFSIHEMAAIQAQIAVLLRKGE